MNQLLVYPDYLPDAAWLRTNLLFADRIKTVVPTVDQNGVLERAEVRGLGPHADDLVELVDPLVFDVEAGFERDATEPFLDQYIARLREEWHHPLEVVDLSPGQTAYLAFQKFPGWLYEKLEDEGLARHSDEPYRTQSGAIVTLNPVALCAPLSDYFMARVAAAASEAMELPAVTNEPLPHAANSLGEGLYRAEDEEGTGPALMSATLQLSVPARIADLPTADYLQLREDYLPIGMELREFFRRLSVDQRIDSPDDYREYVAEIAQVAKRTSEHIQRLRKRQKRARRRDWTTFWLGTAATLYGTALGADVGDVDGALAGAVPPVTVDLVTRLAPEPEVPTLNPSYRNIAGLADRIDREARRQASLWRRLLPLRR